MALGTGGTIEGVAPMEDDLLGYRAGSLGIENLIASVPSLSSWPLEWEEVARIDSKDAGFKFWCRLRARIGAHLARDEVAGAIVPSGTDTLEELTYFLHRTLQCMKPTVLTAAMRPASAASPDGPQNLLDAVLVAAYPYARGVTAVLQGEVHSGAALRKVHGYSLSAFSSGDQGRIALVENGQVRCFREWPLPKLHPAPIDAMADMEDSKWPWVEIVTSCAGARGEAVRALVAAGVRGIVVAGTGNGTVHAALLEALRDAMKQGVRVVRASRCALGGVVASRETEELPTYGSLTPVQARIELLLDLVLEDHATVSVT